MEEKHAEEQRIDRRELKARAREAMGKKGFTVLLVALSFVLISGLLEGLSTRLQYPNLDYSLLSEAMSEGDLDTVMEMMQPTNSFLGNLLNVAVTLMIFIMGVGFSYYCLNLARGVEDAGFSDLFDPFSYFLSTVLLTLVMGFFIFLWSLLLVVPGIIAAYRYSMAYYILMDDPDKPVMECLRESKELTEGHKLELFLLDLSFLGWYLLSVIPLVSCFTAPYMRITRANYYRALSGRMEPPVHVDISI